MHKREQWFHNHSYTMQWDLFKNKTRKQTYQMCIHVQLLCTHTCNININTTRKGVSEDMFLWLPAYAHMTPFFFFFFIVTVFSPFKLDEHNHLSSNFKYGMCLGTNTVLYNSTSSVCVCVGGGGGGGIYLNTFFPPICVIKINLDTAKNKRRQL